MSSDVPTLAVLSAIARSYREVDDLRPHLRLWVTEVATRVSSIAVLQTLTGNFIVVE